MASEKTPFKTILLAAGGTGGHVFPAIATAEELRSRGYRVFFATDRRGEKYLNGKGFEYRIVSSASPNPKRPASLIKLGTGILQSVALLFKTKPVCVIGFGGYPSFPPLITARIFRIKTILHEQNSVLGKANRTLAKFANIVAVSFPTTLNAKNAIVVGNPVRSEITDFPLPEFEGKINILITGGSQGARIFSFVLPEALAKFAGKIKVVQQVGEAEIEQVRTKYETAGIECELNSFFDDMPKYLSETHLLICRSGASTIFELALAGRPAIFIPLAIAAEDHQRINAESIASKGGGWVIPERDFTAPALAAILEDLINNPDKIKEAAFNIRKFAQPEAAAHLADLVESPVGKK